MLRKISGKALLNRERSENTRKDCNVENINKQVNKRKEKWNKYISNIDKERNHQIARDHQQEEICWQTANEME